MFDIKIHNHCSNCNHDFTSQSFVPVTDDLKIKVEGEDVTMTRSGLHFSAKMKREDRRKLLDAVDGILHKLPKMTAETTTLTCRRCCVKKRVIEDEKMPSKESCEMPNFCEVLDSIPEEN